MAETGEAIYSFGAWVRRRRKALDLTQAALANEVGCAEVTIRKLEADAFRPSREIAERLAECLNIAPQERERFVQAARAERSIDGLPLHIDAVDLAPSPARAPDPSIPELDLAPPDSQAFAASSSAETGVIIRDGKDVQNAPRRRVLNRSRQALLTNLLCLLIGITVGMLANPFLLAYSARMRSSFKEDSTDIYRVPEASMKVYGVGDFDGDKKDDVVFLKPGVGGGSTGDYIEIVRSNGAQFGSLDQLSCTKPAVCEVGDFNRDGRDDLVSFQRDASSDDGLATTKVAFSTGTSFATAVEWRTDFCLTDEVCKTGDFDGDRQDDIVVFNQGTGTVRVAISTGTSFHAPKKWKTGFCFQGEVCETGKFDSDDKDDIVSFKKAFRPENPESTVKVALSNGDHFASENGWHNFFCVNEELCGVGDFNGDGQDDIILFKKDLDSGFERGGVMVAVSEGRIFSLPSLWHNSFCVSEKHCGIGDLNGDGKDDIFSQGYVDNALRIAFSTG